MVIIEVATLGTCAPRLRHDEDSSEEVPMEMTRWRVASHAPSSGGVGKASVDDDQFVPFHAHVWRRSRRARSFVWCCSSRSGAALLLSAHFHE